MSGSSTVPAYTGGARQTVDSKAGLGSLALIGIIGVLAIGILAIVLGFTGSNSFIDNIRDKIPGLQLDTKDGWTALDDPAGGFIAQMPEGREKKFVAFAPAANGRLDQWSSVIGNETDLTISYGKVTKADGQSANAALASFADTWATTSGGKIEDTNETGFQGYPAIDVSIRDMTYESQPATAKAMMVLRGDTLYVIQSESIYSDHPAYGRLLGGFQFT